MGESAIVLSSPTVVGEDVSESWFLFLSLSTHLFQPQIYDFSGPIRNPDLMNLINQYLDQFAFQ